MADRASIPWRGGTLEGTSVWSPSRRVGPEAGAVESANAFDGGSTGESIRAFEGGMAVAGWSAVEGGTADKNPGAGDGWNTFESDRVVKG